MPVVPALGPGFFQPIGQKGSRSLGAASKVDLCFNSIVVTFSWAGTALRRRPVKQKVRSSDFISLEARFGQRVPLVGTAADPGWRGSKSFARRAGLRCFP